MKQAVFIKKKRNPMKFAKKVISKRRKRIYNGLSKIQKLIGKNRRKSGQSKLKKKKHLPSRFLRLRLSSAFSLFGRVMKTLVSQRLAKYVINSLLLCSARRDLNKIRKSKSRMKSPTKSRRNVSALQEAFPIETPFALRYRFPKTFEPYLAFFLIFCISFAAN